VADGVPRRATVVAGERRRWSVHLALLVTLAGSLLTLVFLGRSITLHVVVGVAFMVLVVAHLAQRRRTVSALARQWATGKGHSRGPRRLALSDTILELLVVNVLVSGIVDALRHQSTVLPFAPTLGLPPGLDQWHKVAGIVLVIYAIVHVTRRRRRLRRSHIH
jgi:hypothetical protein